LLFQNGGNARFSHWVIHQPLRVWLASLRSKQPI